MKNLLKVAKLAVACYAGIKIGEVIVNKCIKDAHKEEERVPFDDIQPEEEFKVDAPTKAIMIAGGVAVVSLISVIRALEAHAKYVDKSLCESYDRDLLIYGTMLTKCINDPVKDRIQAILSLSDDAINPEVKEKLRNLIAEVK